jgi:hypothetical protein
MSDRPEIEQLDRALKTEARRRLGRSVLLSAALTTLAGVWLFFAVRADQRLEGDRLALDKRAEQAVDIARRSIDPNPPLPQALQQSLDEHQTSTPFVPCAVNRPDGYFVVLGSYQKLPIAVTKFHEFQRSTNEPVRLLWAVNNYFSPVVGVLATREEALAKQRNLRSVVSDAYVFEAWAFPYELIEGNSVCATRS